MRCEYNLMSSDPICNTMLLLGNMYWQKSSTIISKLTFPFHWKRKKLKDVIVVTPSHKDLKPEIAAAHLQEYINKLED